jgi:4-amino-4-deoxy-L-arabinose transferase-like glycosyltransferase
LPTNLPRPTIWITLGLLVFAVLFRLGHVELRGEEPRRAVVALEMLDTGEFVVPHLTGQPYYNKPPVFNWAVAACLAAFPGTENWMVRLPSIVSFLLVGLGIFWIGDRQLGREAATLVALAYLTCGELLYYGTIVGGELDLFYSLVVFAQALAIFELQTRRRWTSLFVISWLLAAVGFLTKGLPSVAFQILTLVATMCSFGHARRLLDPRHLLGLLAFALLTGGYFYVYSLREPLRPLLVTFFAEATQRTGLESRFGELLRGTLGFPLVVGQLLLPWSLLAVWATDRDTWRRMWEHPWTRFCLMFCAVNLPLYWFSGELRNRYLYPFFPFLLVPVTYAFHLNRRRRPRLRTWTERVMGTLLFLQIPGAIALPFVGPFPTLRGAGTLGAAWTLAGVVLFVAFRRSPRWRLAIFVVALVCARIAVDVVYLPAMNLSEVSEYPAEVERMVDIADGRTIQLAGRPGRLHREAAIGPLQLASVDYEVPPSIAYQIPWHYARLTGRPMTWSERMDSPGLYLIDAAQVDTLALPPLMRLHDHWTNAELVLVSVAKDR